MNTTQKPDAHQSHERKPTTPQRDDNKQHPGQSRPTNPDRQDHRDTDRNVPHKK
jgi:hypothetical protein